MQELLDRKDTQGNKEVKSVKHLHSFPEKHSPQISMCSPTQKLCEPVLLGFYGGFITQGCLIKSLVIDNRLTLQPFFLPLDVRWLVLKPPTL